MRLHFLKATDGTPLTKSFTKGADGRFEKTAYPSHLYEVDSTSVEVANIHEFHTALTAAASFNQALQKGELDCELRGESRANHTLIENPTQWALFDIDGLPGITDVEQFIHDMLPDAFHDVSYIAQYSASSGIVDKGLSVHLFFVLINNVHPQDLKNWLRLVNLTNPLLANNLTLQNGNKSALKWPLDVSVAGNDKYVYIAPPVCTNFQDPLLGNRIQLVTKSQDAVNFAFVHPGRDSIRKLERAKIEELRTTESLPKLRLTTVSRGGFDVLIDADPVEVTQWWESGGFIHMNLNGGDSGAYWVNPRRPKYIHSFKDEPSRILKEVAPEFWREIKDRCTVDEMLVFRDVLADRFYAGRYDPIEDEYSELHMLQRGNLKDWAEFHFAAQAPDPIPQYKLVFAPDQDFVVDRAGCRVNLFQPTEYMQLTVDREELHQVPPTVGKIVNWVMNHDEEVVKWFYNWLAFIFQTRRKSKVALVLHGTVGTGKGVLFSRIIRPLFGEKLCREVQQDEIQADRFNEYLGQTLFLMLDESQAQPEFRNKLFHWITEEQLRLREAYRGAVTIDSYTNFILASNRPDAAPIEARDRRFTVAPRQETSIELTAEEVETRIPEELSDFARFLKAYKVDEFAATHPMATEAKETMRRAALDSIDMFIEALNSGDIVYFLELLEAGTEGSIAADAAIKRWAGYVNKSPCPVFMRELISVYKLASMNTMPPSKFMVMVTKRGLRQISTVTDGEHEATGLVIEWTAPPESLRRFASVLGVTKGTKLSELENTIKEAV